MYKKKHLNVISQKFYHHGMWILLKVFETKKQRRDRQLPQFFLLCVVNVEICLRIWWAHITHIHRSSLCVKKKIMQENSRVDISQYHFMLKHFETELLLNQYRHRTLYRPLAILPWNYSIYIFVGTRPWLAHGPRPACLNGTFLTKIQ